MHLLMPPHPYSPPPRSKLEEAGLPQAFLDCVHGGVLPTMEAVTAVPSTLQALCLNAIGLRRVKESKPLVYMVPVFTGKTYLRAMQGGHMAGLHAWMHGWMGMAWAGAV
jgi:hypothetical protein